MAGHDATDNYFCQGGFACRRASGQNARRPPALGGFAVELRRVVGLGDTVLVEGRYRATARATGRPLDAQLAHIWDLRDGRAVRRQQYTDTLQHAEVMGAAPGREGGAAAG